MGERRFEGCVALVTGGRSGIGRATALAFARTPTAPLTLTLSPVGEGKPAGGGHRQRPIRSPLPPGRGRPRLRRPGEGGGGAAAPVVTTKGAAVIIASRGRERGRAARDELESLETGFAQLVPLGRIGRPEEAADAVLWLCAEGTSCVVGQSLIVDEGVTSAYR